MKQGSHAAKHFFTIFHEPAVGRLRLLQCHRHEEQFNMKPGSREIYDELLVNRCQQRDAAAWDELARRWNDRLFYYLRQMSRDEQDALNAGYRTSGYMPSGEFMR